ncbi:MAG: carboxylesterase/lipase family protein [Myxococcota bacterium]
MASIAQTRSGKVEGEERAGVHVFRGIPFAAPPVGPRRWLAPEREAPWSGVRPAKSFGSASPQNALALNILAAFNIEEPKSEDCLYLNVWTPGLDGARRPVMVWIHGGAFTIGSGAQSIYEGTALAKRGDVVVVTINYRLGALGFLRLSELTSGRIPSTGNEGMLDQVAALEWVRENIAAFGGDPGNVTIFGESAGGMSVGTLLGMPKARGLFQKAIPQSGACNTAAPREQHMYVAERFAELCNARGADALLALSTDAVLAGSAAIAPVPGQESDPRLGGMPLQPVIDGEVVPRLSIESVERGSAAGVALLVGSTLDEWKLFAGADPNVLSMQDGQLVGRIEKRLGASARGLIETYRKARTERGVAATPAEVFMAVETDRIFRMPGLQLAETQARHDARVYNYLFTWSSPMFGGMFGACHAVELGFVFGTQATPGVADFTGAGPAVDALAERSMDAWLAFARTGDPSCPSLGRWPTYSAAERATMLLGERCAVEHAPLEEERRAWASVPKHVLGAV